MVTTGRALDSTFWAASGRHSFSECLRDAPYLKKEVLRRVVPSLGDLMTQGSWFFLLSHL